MHVDRLVRYVTCVSFALVVSFPYFALAAPTIDFSCGFDGQTMRHRFMPLRITVSGLVHPIEGSIVVHQTRRSAADTAFPIAYTVHSGMIENRVYRVTIPNTEPLNPVSVELLDHQRDVLAFGDVMLRLGTCEWPFPLFVTDHVLVDRTEPVVDPSELPTDWWAYDAVSSVWLMTPVVSVPVLEALGEWVVSGGSLILFTGTDFPRMDSPTFRKLLPVTTPYLAATADGDYMLAGKLRDRATSRLIRDDMPLLIVMPLGAGSISLITTRFEELTSEEADYIMAETKPAVRMPSIEQVVHEALRNTPVPRPPFLIAPILVGVTLAGVVVFSESRYHLKRLNRLRTFMGMFAGLCLLVLAISVWAGLFAGRYDDPIDVYQTDTTIRVQSSFGLEIALRTLFAERRVDVHVEHPAASFPLPPAVPSIRGVDFSEESTHLQSYFALQEYERRDLTVFDQGRIDIAMRLTPSGAEIVNQTDGDLLEGYILLGDTTYYIPVIRKGAATYALTESYLPEEKSALPTALSNWFPLRRGTVPWLLLIHQKDERIYAEFKDDGIYKQVRKVTLTIIEGESP